VRSQVFLFVLSMVFVCENRGFCQERQKKEDVTRIVGKERLIWKAFRPKTVFYQELVTTTTQDMTILGQEIIQKQTQTFYLKWTAREKTREGNYVATLEIIALKMNIDIGGSNITYDSTAEKQAQNPTSDFFNALVGTKLKFTISPQMGIVNVEGQEQFIQNVGGGNPQMEPLLKSILGTDALKQMVEPTWRALPDTDVARGETWKKVNVVKLGYIGAYTTTFTYSYDGPGDRGRDKIGIKSETKFIKPDTRNGQPFTIKDVKLSTYEGSGVALFDRGKGRFAETTLTMKLEGNLTIEVGGMDTKVKLSQIQKERSTTSDDPPAFLAKGKADDRAQGYCQPVCERNVGRRLVFLYRCIRRLQSRTIRACR
jgi:hypothetical protein